MLNNKNVKNNEYGQPVSLRVWLLRGLYTIIHYPHVSKHTKPKPKTKSADIGQKPSILMVILWFLPQNKMDLCIHPILNEVGLKGLILCRAGLLSVNSNKLRKKQLK